MAPATETGTHTVSAASLKAFTRAILEAAGATPTNAEIVAAGQDDAHLTGHESHGVIRIPGLVRDCQSGKLKPANTPAVVREGAATAVVDGASTIGHVGCKLATEIAIREARQGTLGAVSLTRANHTGRMGEWTELGAAQGLITMVAGSRVNSSRGQVGGLLAPHGGRTGALGTSPTSWAVPPAEGFAEVLLPGEPEARSHAERLEHGIPVPIPIWDDLCATARGLGVPVP